MEFGWLLPEARMLASTRAGFSVASSQGRMVLMGMFVLPLLWGSRNVAGVWISSGCWITVFWILCESMVRGALVVEAAVVYLCFAGRRALLVAGDLASKSCEPSGDGE